MSPQVSMGLIIRYASHNLRFIYSTNTKYFKDAPKFLPESQDENVCQPPCIGSWEEPASRSPKHTSSGSCDIPLSPQINTARHTSSVLKSLKTQSDKITSKGKLNPLQESSLGNVAEIQNFLRITKINLWSNLATRGRRVHLHTLVDR